MLPIIEIGGTPKLTPILTGLYRKARLDGANMKPWVIETHTRFEKIYNQSNTQEVFVRECKLDSELSEQLKMVDTVITNVDDLLARCYMFFDNSKEG